MFSSQPKTTEVSIPDRVLGILRLKDCPPPELILIPDVSIPDRVLGILRPILVSNASALVSVSIPDRVLGILRH